MTEQPSGDLTPSLSIRDHYGTVLRTQAEFANTCLAELGNSGELSSSRKEGLRALAIKFGIVEILLPHIRNCPRLSHEDKTAITQILQRIESNPSIVSDDALLVGHVLMGLDKQLQDAASRERVV